MQHLKGSYLLWGVLLLALLSGGILVQTYFYPAQPASAWPESQVCWVIDPGHGGEDGGAVSRSGEKESLINLEICRRLDLLLAFCGQQTRMLREEDISLHDSSAQTLREKKVSDLKNRVALANATPNGVLLSIHQIPFPSPNTTALRYSLGRRQAPRPWPRPFRAASSAAWIRKTSVRPSRWPTPFTL
mgnify:CR=1 FL=1